MTHENGSAKVGAQDEVEMAPPEGGWGYVICAGLAAMFVICTAHQPTFGMIYNDFLIEIGEGTSGVTLVMGTFGMSVAISGFMSNLFLKRFTLRQAGIVGALFYYMGTILVIFVKSISHMIFAIGILQGLGFGIMVPVCYTNFNMYFTKKRVLLLSLCKACIGLMSMLYPFILKHTMYVYGFRGTLIILSGISTNIFVAMIVMQPVEWHLKRKVVHLPRDSIRVIVTSESNPQFNVEHDDKLSPIDETIEVSQAEDKEAKEPLLTTQVAHPTEKHHFTGSSKPTSPVGSTKDVRSNSLTVSQPFRRNSYNLAQEEGTYLGVNSNPTTPVGSIKDIRRNSSHASRKNSFNLTPGEFHENQSYIETIYRATSLSSLSNMGNIPMDPLPPNKEERKKWKLVVDLLDLSLLKDKIYCNIIIGTGLAFFSDLTFFILQPLYLYHIGFTDSQVATVISVGAGTDLAGRVLMAVAGRFVTLTGRQIMFFGAVTTTLFRLVFLLFTNFMAVAILTGINGLFRCCVQIPLALVVAEHVPIKRFPAAYGLFMFASGFINVVIGPGIGLIRDLSGSYIYAFLALNFCNFCCIIPWIIEYFYLRTKNKAEDRKHSTS